MSKTKSKGHSLIEMVCAMVIIIPLFLCLIDLYFLTMGYWWCASTCRLAARAASQGPPNAVALKAPQNRVQQVLDAATESNSSVHIEQSDVCESISNLPDPVVGGPVTGKVTVSISASIGTPFILRFVMPGQKFIVNASQTCPYTWVQQSKTP